VTLGGALNTSPTAAFPINRCSPGKHTPRSCSQYPAGDTACSCPPEALLSRQHHSDSQPHQLAVRGGQAEVNLLGGDHLSSAASAGRRRRYPAAGDRPAKGVCSPGDWHTHQANHAQLHCHSNACSRQTSDAGRNDADAAALNVQRASPMLDRKAAREIKKPLKLLAVRHQSGCPLYTRPWIEAAGSRARTACLCWGNPGPTPIRAGPQPWPHRGDRSSLSRHNPTRIIPAWARTTLVLPVFNPLGGTHPHRHD